VVAFIIDILTIAIDAHGRIRELPQQT
jgi:hypothetical protein